MKCKWIGWAILALSIAISGCNDDDDDDGNTAGPPPQPYAFISGPTGVNLDITFPDGSTESQSGTFVTGWDGGQLLNLNYFRQLRFSTDSTTFFFRINIPQDTASADVLVRTHELYGFPVLLQDTQFLGEVLPELYCPFEDEGTPLGGNASGTLKIERDVNTALGTYSIIGEVNALFINNGQETQVEGFFYSEEFDW